MSEIDVEEYEKRCQEILEDDEVRKIRTRNDELNLEEFDFDSDDLKISNEDKPAFLRRQMD